MATTMKLIAKVQLTSTASTIEFTSIPGTYTDLFLVHGVRTNRSFFGDDITLRVNGSSTGYSYRGLYGAGTTAASFSATSATFAVGGYAPSTNATASTFGSCGIYIPNYAGSTNKSISQESVQENNSATENTIYVSASLWANTAAITSISIFPNAASTSFVSGSSAFLYGITRA